MAKCLHASRILLYNANLKQHVSCVIITGPTSQVGITNCATQIGLLTISYLFYNCDFGLSSRLVVFDILSARCKLISRWKGLIREKETSAGREYIGIASF